MTRADLPICLKMVRHWHYVLLPIVGYLHFLKNGPHLYLQSGLRFSDVTMVKICIRRMRISTLKSRRMRMRIEAFILSVGT